MGTVRGEPVALVLCSRALGDVNAVFPAGLGVDRLPDLSNEVLTGRGLGCPSVCRIPLRQFGREKIVLKPGIETVSSQPCDLKCPGPDGARRRS
jgi:hypothetical protein